MIFAKQVRDRHSGGEGVRHSDGGAWVAVGETLFREMSLSTRMLSIYLEMDEGREYLRSVALDLLTAVTSVDHSLEVNPHHISASERVNYKANLEKIVEISQKFLDRVLSSASRCPL